MEKKPDEIQKLQKIAGIEPKKTKYKVVFYDYGDEEYPSKEVFNSRLEAMDFAESGMWEEDYEYIGNDGEDYYATRDRYYSKEYDESFYSYTIEKI